jgi:rhodanese-related sulfurtransferase
LFGLLGYLMQSFFAFLQQHWVLSLPFVAVFFLLIIIELKRKSGDIMQVGPSKLTDLMNHVGAVCVDVRTKELQANGVIVGAISMPDAEAPTIFKKFSKKNKPVVIIDANGQQAVALATALRKQGLASVYALTGGMQAWSQAGMPSVNAGK